MIKNFNGITVAEYNSAKEAVCEKVDSDLIRIEIPSNSEDMIYLQKEGFFFVDRNIGVSITISKVNADFSRIIRVETVLENSLSSQVKEKLLEIAIDSFLLDRRFNLRLQCSKEISRKVLSEHIKDIKQCFLAYHKSDVIGFLYLKKIDDESFFVELAAVIPKFRISGAALSLYASAVQWAKDNHAKRIIGRISTQNVAVINLYNYFGASYFEPHDIFIKENNDGLQ